MCTVPVIFRTESRDGPSGQSNLRLLALIDDSVVGKIDYAEFQGKPFIQMIEVAKNSRRNGYATSLILHLQSSYPDQEINWGMLTGDGSKLYDSLPKRFVVNPEYSEKVELLIATKEKIAVYSKLSDAFFSKEYPSEAERNEFTDATADWNDLNDIEWELEQYMRSSAPGFTLIAADYQEVKDRPRQRA